MEVFRKHEYWYAHGGHTESKCCHDFQLNTFVTFTWRAGKVSMRSKDALEAHHNPEKPIASLDTRLNKLSSMWSIIGRFANLLPQISPKWRKNNAVFVIKPNIIVNFARSQSNSGTLGYDPDIRSAGL